MSGTGLRVRSVDFQKEFNSKVHHTKDFVTPSLVVRRGQPFTIRLDLTQDLIPQDEVVLQLSTGGQHQKTLEVLLQQLPVAHSPRPGCWSATVIRKLQNRCEVEVSTAPDVSVGKYRFSLKTGSGVIFEPENRFFYLLFNPWCQEDTVFLSDENARQEYVLSDTGYIYVGLARDISPKPWNFGQFEERVLDICVGLLGKADLKPDDSGDPVKVSRAMSALVNFNNDVGVLVGNWTGTYTHGTPPMEWIGSSNILQKYGQTGVPVRYGQCWVFSGVLTTVMRCLGIPCRSVTNFTSAHDTGGNVTIDVYVNENGERLNNMTKDSIWNFHVWNDVWMKRRDLSPGYDGWQAIDATPQEESQGIFQCGPSPLRAIKNGDIEVAHDTKFLFAEVNADQVTWRVERFGTDQEKITKLRVYPGMVGRNISTKAVGHDVREDITPQYKFFEGSPDERRVMEKASGGLIQDIPAQGPAHVQLAIQAESSIPLGSPISLCVALSSQDPQPLTLTLAATAQLQAYNGKSISTLKTLKQEVTLVPGASTTIPMRAEPGEYLPQVSQTYDDLLVRVTAVAESKNPHFICIEDIIITFQYPHLTMDIPPTGSLGKPFTCTFTFKNTTATIMENCKLLVEGLGLFKLDTFNEGDIGVGKIFRSKVTCIPIRTGRRKVVARITSRQISGITAEGTICIEQS